MPNKKHALIFVTLTVLLDTIGFGVIMPVLPQFLMQLTGQSLAETSQISGYLMVSYALLQFLFAPIIGNLSDRYGRRPVLLWSLFFYGINYLIAGFATALWMLFIGRILTGITSATYATANALIADVSPPEERAQNFGLLGVAFGVGFIIGPSLGACWASGISERRFMPPQSLRSSIPPMVFLCFARLYRWICGAHSTGGALIRSVHWRRSHATQSCWDLSV